MKVTAITVQQKNANRVNVMIDGVYRFSLDITQVGTLGVKVGKEFTDEEIARIESESEFGKLYARTLEYCLLRPHSAREVKDYLWRKTRATKYKSRKTGELRERAGIPVDITERVFERLVQKKYIDDEKFARFWVENRNLSKGASRRKITTELQAKGVGSEVIAEALQSSDRDDTGELQKVIAKKRSRYPDSQKFIQYLVRQGFRYDDIRQALAELPIDEYPT